MLTDSEKKKKQDIHIKNLSKMSGKIQRGHIKKIRERPYLATCECLNEYDENGYYRIQKESKKYYEGCLSKEQLKELLKG